MYEFPFMAPFGNVAMSELPRLPSIFKEANRPLDNWPSLSTRCGALTLTQINSSISTSLYFASRSLESIHARLSLSPDLIS
jgi:hypothetical protein